MTHFPLPDGICRTVCRPKRTEQRTVTTKAAVRFSRAAVTHGADPCDVVKAIRQAIGAKCNCEQQQEDVIQGLDVLADGWDDLWLALLELVEALIGIKSWEEFDKLSKVKWWQVLWSRLKFIWSIKDVADALWDVIDAIRTLRKQETAFRQAVADLIVCLNEEKGDV